MSRLIISCRQGAIYLVIFLLFGSCKTDRITVSTVDSKFVCNKSYIIELGDNFFPQYSYKFRIVGENNNEGFISIGLIRNQFDLNWISGDRDHYPSVKYEMEIGSIDTIVSYSQDHGEPILITTHFDKFSADTNFQIKKL